MPRSAEDNQQIRDARREEILEAATQVFAERGFARTKISDIAAAAGVSHGLLYHYFDSKAGVFGAMVEAMIERIESKFDAPGDTAYERMVGSIDATRERMCGQDVEANRLVVHALMQGSVPEAIRVRVNQHLESLFERSVARMREAQADGDVDPSVSAEELTAALMMLMRGMALRAPGMPELPLPLPSTATILRLLRPLPADDRATD